MSRKGHGPIVDVYPFHGAKFEVGCTADDGAHGGRVRCPRRLVLLHSELGDDRTFRELLGKAERDGWLLWLGEKGKGLPPGEVFCPGHADRKAVR